MYRFTYLSDKDPEEQQCDVPCEEEEGGTDPQVVEQGQVQQSSDGVERMDGAGGRDGHTRMKSIKHCEEDIYNYAHLVTCNPENTLTCSNGDQVFYRSMLSGCNLLISKV